MSNKLGLKVPPGKKKQDEGWGGQYLAVVGLSHVGSPLANLPGLSGVTTGRTNSLLASVVLLGNAEPGADGYSLQKDVLPSARRLSHAGFIATVSNRTCCQVLDACRTLGSWRKSPTGRVAKC
ncbi:hypothetical protein RRG08_059725 [Elysia crispata]|uniref:Uncharacterized protein n=1 Tax=Elysia crispata TaxID=231223 RepID=A0AAE0YN74_9GAST|nr:hypothetical protein RRG08_059725 [Elysia crispata]